MGLCWLSRCKAGKANWGKVVQRQRKKKSDSLEKYKLGRVACKVARLTSSEPSLQKQVSKGRLSVDFAWRGVIKERQKTIGLPVEYSAQVFIDLEEKDKKKLNQCQNTSLSGPDMQKTQHLFRSFILCRLNPKIIKLWYPAESQEGRKLRQQGKELFEGSCYRFLSGQSKGAEVD